MADVNPRYTYGPLLDGRRIIARVVRIEDVGEHRTSYELDGIDAEVDPERLDKVFSDPEQVEPFALVRVSSTPKRLRKRFGVALSEGDWVEMLIVPKKAKAGPIAHVAQLGRFGFVAMTRGRLAELSRIAGPDDPVVEFVELSASVSAATVLAGTVRKACKLPSAAHIGPAAFRRILRPIISQTRALLVRDVGQANFITLRDDEFDTVAHFDAGWPLVFNGRTVPRKPPVISAAPVLLSHWDWDHLHAYHSVGALQDCHWYAPDQEIGPNKYKVALALHNKRLLHVYSHSTAIKTPDGALLIGNGKSLNDGGFALELSLESNRDALLVGDGAYQSFAGGRPSKTYHFLVATHHGAKFEGPAPTASGARQCVISVGRGNVYRHPVASAVRAHRRRKWLIEYTSRRPGRSRGDRLIP
jgi:competence protein ComEC